MGGCPSPLQGCMVVDRVANQHWDDDCCLAMYFNTSSG